MHVDPRDGHQKRTRQTELDEAKRLEQERIDAERKNHGFAQVYPLGWKRISELARLNAQALQLYIFLANHLDPACGAVVASQHFLSEQLGVTTKTISRWSQFLEENNALVRIPVAGKVYAYALDPEEVWKGYNSSKGYAAFNSKTLANYDGDIQRRIMSMFEGRKSQKSEQQELEESGQQRLFQ